MYLFKINSFFWKSSNYNWDYDILKYAVYIIKTAKLPLFPMFFHAKLLFEKLLGYLYNLIFFLILICKYICRKLSIIIIDWRHLFTRKDLVMYMYNLFFINCHICYGWIIWSINKILEVLFFLFNFKSGFDNNCHWW